jgi:hypothetical protein
VFQGLKRDPLGFQKLKIHIVVRRGRTRRHDLPSGATTSRRLACLACLTWLPHLLVELQLMRYRSTSDDP